MFKTLDPEEIQACLIGHPQSWPQILVERTLAKGNPGQDNVTVVSVTFDTGALGKWDPKSPPSIFQMPREPARAAKSSSERAWLLAAALLLLIAVAFGGLWYFSAR